MMQKTRKNEQKRGSQFFRCGKQYCWEEDCPNIEEEQRGQLHTNIVIVKDNFNEEEKTTGMSCSENHQKTKTEKTLDTNKI